MEDSKVKYNKFYLPNGLKCILYKRKDVHSINLSVVVNSGSLDEENTNNGVSHFIEHLAFDGTKELSTWDKVNDYLNNISGTSNAYTSFDHTKYYGTFPSKYVEEAIFYLSQLVLHPIHKNEDLEKEKIIIIDEMRGYEDSIGHTLYRTMIENRFTTKNSNFCYDIIGTEDNLRKFKKEDVNAGFENFYVPENMEIYVVGDFEVPKIKKLLKKYFYDDVKDVNFKNKPQRVFHKEYPQYSNFNINVGKKLDLSQYYLTVSFPCYEFALTPQSKRHLQGFVTSMTASSQYQNSVLWKRLREELGIVYGVNSWTHSMYNRAFMAVETSFNPEFLETVIEEVYKGINNIRENSISDEIFKTRQKRIIDTELMRYDNPNNVLSWIVDQEDEFATHNTNLSISQYLDLIKNYKFEDVLKTANEVFDWKAANITVVSKEDTSKVQKQVDEIWKKVTK